MSWNHRVYYDINHGMWFVTEVHYHDGSDKPKWLVPEGVSPCGETREELRDTLALMVGALARPPLQFVHGGKIEEYAEPAQRDEDDGYGPAFWNMCEVLDLAEQWLRMDHDKWTRYQRSKAELVDSFIDKHAESERRRMQERRDAAYEAAAHELFPDQQEKRNADDEC